MNAALKGAATGADEIWTVGVTAGADVNTPSSEIPQLFTRYFASALVLWVKVGCQTPLKTRRWRTSSAELPFSPR